MNALRGLALLGLFLGGSPASLAADFSRFPNAADVMPKGLEDMGFHALIGEIWGSRDPSAFGPEYCVYDGKVICISYNLLAADLDARKNWFSFPGLKGLPAVDHIEMSYWASGGGGAIKRGKYALTLYFATSEELQAVQQ